jgi:hypothetical protein
MMDFFETREKYRRREARFMVSLFWRVAVLGLVFWGGWYWGNADQARLQAEANQILLESSDEIIMLKRQLDQALRAKDALLAREVSDEMAARLGTESLSRTIRSLMASGVAPEQIEQALQSVTEPVNCKQTGSYRMAVATDLSSGAESSLALFDGGLRLHLDGEMQARGTRNDPWFDPELPVTLRLAYLGGQKIISDPLPMEVFVAADSLLVQLELKQAALRGYVDLSVRQCRIR